MLKFFGFIILGTFLVSCSAEVEVDNGEETTEARSAEAIQQDIKENREKFRKTDDRREKTEITINLIGYFNDHVEHHPDHEKSPEYLYQAANLSAQELDDYQQAIDLFEELVEKYPDHEKAPEAMFTIAYLYETGLDNPSRAEMIFEEFIEKYPDHDLKDDAVFAIEIMDKDPADVVREFQQREDS